MNTDRKQYAHLYGRTWRYLRDAFLRAHPLCVYCQELGYLTPATCVDHEIPHKGDRALFFDQSNWQPLCDPCHNGAKQQLERTGHRPGTRPDGTPVDPLHPWNRDSASKSLAGHEQAPDPGYGGKSLAAPPGQRTRSEIFARAIPKIPVFDHASPQTETPEADLGH